MSLTCLIETVGKGKGCKHREESKQKMSEIRKNKNTGENNSFFGKHHSEETKQKIREKILEIYLLVIKK